ncbi:MAG: CPBP family intramembrane glutamic endopeptidase [Planctomycetota bacterium]
MEGEEVGQWRWFVVALWASVCGVGHVMVPELWGDDLLSWQLLWWPPAAVVAALLAMPLVGRRWWRDSVGRRRRVRETLLGIGGGLVAGAGLWASGSEPGCLAPVDIGHGMPLWAGWLAVMLIAPIAEELLFRGLLWVAVERLVRHSAGAFVFTSALFVVAHLPQDVWRVLGLCGAALVLSLLRVFTRGIGASIVAHVTANTLLTLVVLQRW